jgi:cytochrome c oxidase subunit 3
VPDTATRFTHHYEDAEHRHESAVLGMWVFLATEVLFFGGLFAGYVAYRAAYAEAYIEASGHLNIWFGSVNTLILLTSSFAIALAIHAAQTGRRRAVTGFLLVTLVLGLAFLGIKGVEYYTEYQEGLIPGLRFTYEGERPHEVALFFVQYFIMTGLHAVHMIIGLGVVAWMAWRNWRGDFSPTYYDPIEMTGLYWHFVDVVWVFLFPLLYLIERTPGH